MTKTVGLTAEARDRAGKGTARATRREGNVPAVIYGRGEAASMISLNERELTKLMHKPGFFTHLYRISANGKTELALARDLQLHPVSDRPLHVDFLRVSNDTQVTVEVPVEFTGQDTSPGLKAGGVLNIVAHTLTMLCPASDIPESLVVDVSKAQLQDTIHASSLQLPKGASLVAHGDEDTIATVVAPSALRSEGGEAPAAETDEA